MKKEKILIIGAIIIIIIIIIVLIASIYLYLEEQENKKLDAESVIIASNLEVEFGEEVKVSDFLEYLNGTLVEDFQINTEQLGEIEVTFQYINIKNKERTANFTINVIDTVAPTIYMSSTYTVKTGYSKDLTQVFFSGDNVDDNPTREIVGQYDLNVEGEYNLVYVVTDASGNQTQKEFTLYVKDDYKAAEAEESEPVYIEDVIDNYKNENTAIGIDVSKWQGDIDWEKVKNAGVEFVMIRLGYQTDYDGDYVVDPYFQANIEGAQNAGLSVGIYFYSYANSLEQATSQAEWVIEQLSGYTIDLPIAFDWESWSSFNKAGMSFYKINKVANTFIETLEEAGYTGMLYSSKNYLERIWEEGSHKVWLAHYTLSQTTYQGNYMMWQMCNTGRVDGINGAVDIDIMYKEEV